MANLQKGPSCHPSGITGYGNWEPDGVCFVGIAPGRDEWQRSGTPLTGPSGQLLDSILEAIGWPRERCYATNLICWWKDAPNLHDIVDCWNRLSSELRDLNPKLIIPLGEIATDFLLGNLPYGLLGDNPPSDDWNKYTWNLINHGEYKGVQGEEYFGFGSRRGRTTWASHLGAYVMPTYHPAGALRTGGAFVSDIIRALTKIQLVIEEFADGGLESQYNWGTIQSPEEGNELLRNLPRGVPGVALDIETNYGQPDIDWFSEDLLCLSLTWGWNSTRVIPGNIAKQLDWGLAEGVHWIGQNFIFDSGGVRRWIPSLPQGLEIGEDTMFESYALDERPGHHDLETLGGEWCAAPFWKSELAKYTVTRQVQAVDKYGQPLTKKDGSPRLTSRKFREVPNEALYKYNAGDTTYTYRAHVRQWARVRDDNMERVYRDLLIPAANAFRHIQYRGLYVDQFRQLDLLEEWYDLKWAQEDELNQVVHDEWPDLPANEKLNFRSQPQMVKFIYEVLGAPKQFKRASTKGKQEEPKLTTDKDALDALTDFHPFFRLFKDFRQTDHQISVSQGIMERIKSDGMLHAVPQLHGTETGRLSYKDPNLQNIAQDWMVGPNLARIREIFAPKNPDTHFLAEADYKQIELWMAVHWSQDDAMMEGLVTGDFHRVTAMDVFHKTWDEVTKGDRFFTKIITFGRLYERGAADMKRGRGFEDQSLAEIEEWIRRWSAKYYQYIQWSEGLKRQAIDDGIIVSPWGRKRRYYLVMGDEAHHQLRSALNFCMQSTAHDYTLSSLIRLQPLLAQYDSYILTENHDALLFEISKKYWREVQELVTSVMESVRPNSEWPTLRVDWKTGPNWGQAHEACTVCGRFYPDVPLPQEIALSPTVHKLMCAPCYSSQNLLQKVA